MGSEPYIADAHNIFLTHIIHAKIYTPCILYIKGLLLVSFIMKMKKV